MSTIIVILTASSTAIEQDPFQEGEEETETADKEYESYKKSHPYHKQKPASLFYGQNIKILFVSLIGKRQIQRHFTFTVFKELVCCDHILGLSRISALIIDRNRGLAVTADWVDWIRLLKHTNTGNRGLICLHVQTVLVVPNEVKIGINDSGWTHVIGLCVFKYRIRVDLTVA